MSILKRLVSSISAIVRSISASFGEWLKTVGNHRLATSIKSFCRRSTLSLSSVQNSYLATPEIKKSKIWVKLSFRKVNVLSTFSQLLSVLIFCENSSLKSISKFPVSSYWSWNFPHCTGSGINRGGVAYANGKCHKVSILHSSILSKSRSTSQKWNCMLCMQMENATGPPLHHAGYSFKVKIKCGKDGSVKYSFSTVNYKGDDTNSFFLQIQLFANRLVRCKEGGLEQHFLYEVRNYA